MAICDMFLKVESARQGPIKGESGDSKHAGEIEVIAWSWGMECEGDWYQNKASREGGRTTIHELQITKRVDTASTGLMAALRRNDPIKKAVLSVRKASGETGLDYYWHKDAPEWQRARFRTHIRAARRCAKPLIIHTRDSAADTLRLMQEEGAGEAGGVMHCFTETLEVAKGALDLGFYISFSGIVSFKTAASLREVARYVPADRLLVETDAPYLAPVPFRGKTNQPAYVRHVAEAVAAARGETLEAVAEVTTRNFFRLFKDARP